MSQTTATNPVADSSPATSDEICYIVDDDASMRKSISRLLDFEGFKVRAFGDTAVSSYRMMAEAAFEGTEIKRQLCITNVWMKRNGGWQVVARHTASLPGDTPSAQNCERTS